MATYPAMTLLTPRYQFLSPSISPYPIPLPSSLSPHLRPDPYSTQRVSIPRTARPYPPTHDDPIRIPLYGPRDRRRSTIVQRFSTFILGAGVDKGKGRAIEEERSSGSDSDEGAEGKEGEVPGPLRNADPLGELEADDVLYSDELDGPRHWGSMAGTKSLPNPDRERRRRRRRRSLAVSIDEARRHTLADISDFLRKNIDKLLILPSALPALSISKRKDKGKGKMQPEEEAPTPTEQFDETLTKHARNGNVRFTPEEEPERMDGPSTYWEGEDYDMRRCEVRREPGLSSYDPTSFPPFSPPGERSTSEELREAWRRLGR